MGALLFSTTGCQNYVFSPPARVVPLESAATLPRGDTGVQAEGGSNGAFFGVQTVSGTLRVRRGLDDETDVAGEVSLLHVQGDSAAGTNPNAYAARFGVKRRLYPALSLTGGIGGGGSAAGGFVSPDLGVIVAYENPYVIPFVSLRGSVSVPIAPAQVDTSASNEAVGSHVFTPHLTWIGGGTGGVRVPIGAPPNTRAALLGGLSYTHLADVNDKEGVFSITGGVEVIF